MVPGHPEDHGVNPLLRPADELGEGVQAPLFRLCDQGSSVLSRIVPFMELDMDYSNSLAAEGPRSFLGIIAAALGPLLKQRTE